MNISKNKKPNQALALYDFYKKMQYIARCKEPAKNRYAVLTRNFDKLMKAFPEHRKKIQLLQYFEY